MTSTVTKQGGLHAVLHDWQQLFACPYMYYVEKRRRKRTISIGQLESLAEALEQRMMEKDEGEMMGGASFPSHLWDKSYSEYTAAANERENNPNPPSFKLTVVLDAVSYHSPMPSREGSRADLMDQLSPAQRADLMDQFSSGQRADLMD